MIQVEKASREQLEMAIVDHEILDVNDTKVLDRLLKMNTEKIRGIVRDWVLAVE